MGLCNKERASSDYRGSYVSMFIFGTDATVTSLPFEYNL